MMPDLSAQSGPCAQPDTRAARPHGNKVSEGRGAGDAFLTAQAARLVPILAAALPGGFRLSLRVAEGNRDVSVVVETRPGGAA